jgi:mono/diheme cytochrome c family protein
MDKKILSLTLLLALFFIIACEGTAPQTPPATATPTQTVPQPTAIPATDPATDTPAAEAATGVVSYANQIMPILEARCIKCHGVETKKEGLDMRTYDDLIAGSFNGPVLTPGDAGNSLLVQLIERGKMPNRGPKVTPEELQNIIDWINQGALNN